MAEYTITELSPMGDRDDKYGQIYWGQATESAVPVMFNSMSEELLGPGIKIEFESLAPQVSKKGNPYVRLKKVRVIGHIEPEKAPKDEYLQYLKKTFELVYQMARNSGIEVSDDGLLDLQQPEPTAEQTGEDEEPEEEPMDTSEIPF